MSAVLVQGSGKLIGNNVNSPITLNAPGNFTAGNTVIVPSSLFGGPITSMQIAGAAATKAAFATGNPNAPEIWYIQNVTGGRSDVVITITGGTGIYYSASIDEWSGLASSALDAVFSNGSGSSTTPNVTVGPFSQAAVLVYGVFVPVSGILDATTVPAAPWVTSYVEPDGNTNEPGGASYQITAATTAVSATWTLATSQPWYTCAASFKIAAGGGAVSNSLFFGSGA